MGRSDGTNIQPDHSGLDLGFAWMLDGQLTGAGCSAPKPCEHFGVFLQRKPHIFLYFESANYRTVATLDLGSWILV